MAAVRMPDGVTTTALRPYGVTTVAFTPGRHDDDRVDARTT
jgi:hypothetical protein